MSARAPLFGLLAAILVGVLFVFFAYGPKVEEQRLLEEETAQLLSQQQQLQTQIAELESIRANQPEIEAQLAQLEDLIPSSLSQASAIRQFQVAADQANVNIQSVSFADPAVQEPQVDAGDGLALADIATTMVLQGGYFQQVDFFRRVEVDKATNPRALLIDSVSMTETSLEEGFPALDATWTGRLFAVITPPADPNAVPPAPTPSPGASETPADGATPPPPASEEPA